MTAIHEEPFRVGELVPGTRWFMRRELGRGGMGVVLEVYRNELLPGFRGAMKILRPMAAHRSQCERWFVQELELLTRFHHDNIVKVTDFGTTTDDAPWFVMELLEGPTLRSVMRDAKRLRRKNPDGVHPSLKPAEVWKIVREICAGLHYAHSLKPPVVHRDVKAENVVLRKLHKGSRVILLDYGIAHVLDAGRASDLVVGTPRCFSPEMLRGESITAKADLYALAILVYELLTLEFPYDVNVRSASELEHAHLYLQPIPLCQRVASLPATVDAALLRALSKDPKDRQAGVLEFLNEISALLQMADPLAADLLDPAVTDPDVRTPLGAPGPDGAGETEKVDVVPKESEPPAPGHWLEVDRARWGMPPVLSSAAALAASVSQDPLTSEIGPGRGPDRSHQLPAPSSARVRRAMGTSRVALGMAAGVLVLVVGGWKTWTAARDRPKVDRSIVLPAEPWFRVHAAADVPALADLGTSAHEGPLAASAVLGDLPPPGHPDAGLRTGRPVVRAVNKADSARAAPRAASIDDVVVGAPGPPPNLDDIVFSPSKAAAAPSDRLGSGKDPAPMPRAPSIARHP